MFEVSFIPSLRRHGNKGERTEMLRAASSYYMPEGRFYDAPVVLKQKKRKSRVLPVFFGASLSALAATSVHKADLVNLASPYKALMANGSEIQANSVAANDKEITSNITLSKNEQKEPLSKTDKVDTDYVKAVDATETKTTKEEKNTGKKAATKFDLSASTKLELPHIGMRIPYSEHLEQTDTFAIARYTEKSGDKSVTADKNTKKIADKAETKIALVIPQKKPVAKLPVPKILKNLVTNDNPDILALGYAPANAKVDTSAFDSVLTDQHSPIDRNGRFIPPIGRNDHAWAATPLPAEAFTAKEQKCLAEAVYFESRGESIKGQAAVAQVVLNRVRNPAYPKTICGVVYQNTNWINHCQFSFACDGRKHKVTEMAQWTVAQQVARAVSAGQIWFPKVGSATHYHAVYVRPRWASTMIKVDKIGLHIFYRTRYGGWI